MKPSTRPSRMRPILQRNIPALSFLISLVVTLVSGVLLFNAATISGLSSTIITTGLDPLRAQLIAALIMSAGSALIGAVIGRRKLGALLGAWIVFSFGYLLDFIQLQMRPAYDPGGHLEPLDMGALVHTSFVMIALALLSAFVGAAVGIALSQVLFDPPYRLVRHLRQRYSHTEDAAAPMYRDRSRPSTAFTMIGSWFTAIVMIVVLILASGSVDLFIFSPDIGLHTMPDIPAKNAGIPSHGTIVADRLVSPALRGQTRPFLVYLPPTYNTPAGQSKRYPVLYLLHGSPGEAHDWFTPGKANQSADTLIALGAIPELILVLPDGNGRPGAPSEWGNSFDQRQLIETFVANDLVKYVDQKYRTIPKAAYRGIGGLSMGGFGAMNIAVHHADVFGFVISLGGYYHAEGSIWGNNATYMRQNSPVDVLPQNKQAWKLHIFLGAGTKDQPYYTYAKQFAHELDQLRIPYHLDTQNGYHSWAIWQTQLYNALIWLHWG